MTFCGYPACVAHRMFSCRLNSKASDLPDRLHRGTSVDTYGLP